jgi:virginiamycin A acetyltransferase
MNRLIGALTTYPALYERKFGVVESDVVPTKALVIEDDVWIGNNVVILLSSTIRRLAGEPQCWTGVMC